MKAERAKSMSELGTIVSQVLADVQDDRNRCPQAHEIGNLAGKLVGMCKIHLEYCSLNKCKSEGYWAQFITK